MIPYPYNFVDMGGIDLAEIHGQTVEGLYSKIVEAATMCGEVVLYNWKFADIDIAPQHTNLLITEEAVTINGLVQVTEQDEVLVPGLIPPPALVQLAVTENGQYYPIDYDADGFDEVSVSVEAGGFSDGVVEYVFYASPPLYKNGYEYKNPIYGTQLEQDCELVLLADASQGADSVQLTESISNFSGVVLQGIYSKQRTSAFNVTLLYLNPQLNVAYWAGMRDRNSSYTCNVTFTSDTSATLSGNKQVIIYGIP